METKLLSINEWREQMFSPDSRPHRNTVDRWIKKGLIPVKRFGTAIYIITPVGGEPLPSGKTEEQQRVFDRIAAKL